MTAVTLHAQPTRHFNDKLQETLSLLGAVVSAYPRGASDTSPRVVQASSLGAEDMVISHMLDSGRLDAGIVVLETGLLHPETLRLLEQLKSTSRLPISVYRPQAGTVVQFVAREGGEAMYKSVDLRKACCGIRKIEPLLRALAGKKAWITGLRREQSGARAELGHWDDADPAIRKLNPLANWSWGDVWHYIALHQVAYNPLHDQFFPSIGCAPCTRAISVGEDFRAGRWWWEEETAKECGLHAAKPQQKETTA